MKLRNIINTCMVGAALLFAACTPDEYSLAKPDLQPADLVEGVAFSVTVDESNTVTLKSLLPENYNCFWTQPNGRSQGNEVKIQLPFAGTYEVTFGVDTRGGIVYSEPYQFQLTTNNMSLLEDPLYEYLTGGVGKSKTWVPVDKDYGVGSCTGPVMYCNPDDVLNDGSASTDIGINHMSPNWDPGFQSWLIPADAAYMDSYMTFALDDVNGCSITEYRGEEGAKGSSTGTTLSGKFNLNLSDKNHPLLSFTDTYLMHNTGFDGVCENYTTDLYITALTPYLLQVAAMRTNSEGAWWIIWNFIAKDVQDGKVTIPTDDAGLIEKVKPTLPTFENIHTDLFTTEINGDKYVASKMTYNLDSETPYDFLWWNGSPSVKKWESVTGGSYNTTWAPALDDKALDDFELIIAKKSDGGYSFECGDVSGDVEITENTMTFSKEISVFAVSNDYRTIELKGTEFYILNNSADDQYVTIGVPETTDEDGNVNTYLVAKLAYKQVTTGPVGPTKVSIDNSIIHEEGIMWVENGCLRVGFHHYGESGKGLFKDVKSVKLKKNQAITVVFKIDGLTWEKTPKCALIDNNIKTTWEPGCYDLDDAVTVNTSGETTVSLTNNTGSTQTFTATCLDLSIQLDGYAEGSWAAGGDLSGVNIEIVSCTIQ